MNILFEITQSGYKLQNQFALNFNELTEKKHIISSIKKNEKCINFIKQNKFYNKIYTHKYFDYKKDLKGHEINYDLLNTFEDSLQNTTVWNMISSDRSLGRTYLHDFVGYEYRSPKNTNDELLKFFSFKLEEIIKF